MEKTILREISVNDKFLVDAYRDKVWHLFPGVIKKLRTGEKEKLLSSPEYRNFSKATSDFFKSTDILKVKIFDSAENEIFTSNKVTIEFDNTNKNGMYEYLNTKLDCLIFKDLIDKGLLLPNASVSIKESPEQNNQAIIAVGYIPIIGISGKAEALVVIYTDVTEICAEIGLLEIKVFTAFFIFFAILFIIIIYNTRYAQNIINKQVLANKLLEEAKRKAESESSAKTQFLANVSHELRTPLNSIIGFSEIILSKKDNETTNMRHIDYVQDIHNSGKHLLSVINDILDYSKVTAKKLTVEMIEVNLNKIVTSSMRFVEPEVKSAKLTIVKDMPDEYIIIKADPQRLKQALLNILSNAIKFTPANGTITLTISKDSQKKRVQIKITDTGIGISKENLPKALMLFEQVDNKKNRRYEGTGLGLPLTKKLVQLMKGRFDIESVSGQGTTVTLTFKYEEILE